MAGSTPAMRYRVVPSPGAPQRAPTAHRFVPRMLPMITLHTWATPNGRKVAILLEELGLPYEVRTVDIGHDAQF